MEEMRGVDSTIDPTDLEMVDSEGQEPMYDLEDVECECTAEGIDPKWEWQFGEGCYVCTGCGATQ